MHYNLARAHQTLKIALPMARSPILITFGIFRKPWF
jgi:hypothetical protein